MENTRVKTILLIFTLVLGTLGQSKFQGLNIDPVQLKQAKAAIKDLKRTLEKNVYCSPQAQLSGSVFGKTFLPFRSISGFSGYNASPPKIKYPSNQGLVFNLIYRKIVKVIDRLQKIREHLIQYNNIVVGSQNELTGSKNVVIASGVNLQGNHNWVFTSDYSSTDTQNGVLILGVYLIELNDLMHITYKPGTVIHCIDQVESNQQFNNFWTKSSQNRRFTF